MSDKTTKRESVRIEQVPRTTRMGLSATGRWENEGGARPEPVPVTSVVSGRASPTAPGQETPGDLDAHQERLMTLASSDGRPPSRRQRMIEWRWFGVAAALALIGTGGWIAIEGVSWGVIVVGLVLAALLLVGASPVLAAGLLRGQEERTARKTAHLERQGHRDH